MTGNYRKRKRRKGLCATWRCVGEYVGTSAYCSKCRHKRTKESNPLRYHFDTLRSNAKRRGHEFGLTLAEFKSFCDRTNYLELKGRGAGCATIDRINPERGYYADNIQILEYASNVRKRYIDDRLRGKLPAAPIDTSDIFPNLHAFGHDIKIEVPF